MRNPRVRNAAGRKGYWAMATPKVQRHVRPQRLRIPSNEEMERVRLLWEYGQAQTKAKKHGLVELLIPPEFRIRRPAPKSARERHEKVMRRIDEIIEERVKERLAA